MPLIVNGIKSEKDDKGHGIENHDLFLWNISAIFAGFLS